MLNKWSIPSFLLFSCTLSACSLHSRTSAGSADSSVHAQAIGHLARAISFANRGIGQGPNVPRATQADLEQAVTEFTEATRLEPDNHQASFGLAETLIKLNKNEKGVSILKTLTKNQDNYARFAQKKLAKMGVSYTK